MIRLKRKEEENRKLDSHARVRKEAEEAKKEREEYRKKFRII
jgi:hypothetical protein